MLALVATTGIEGSGHLSEIISGQPVVEEPSRGHDVAIDVNNRHPRGFTVPPERIGGGYEIDRRVLKVINVVDVNRKENAVAFIATLSGGILNFGLHLYSRTG